MKERKFVGVHAKVPRGVKAQLHGATRGWSNDRRRWAKRPGSSQQKKIAPVQRWIKHERAKGRPLSELTYPAFQKARADGQLNRHGEPLKAGQLAAHKKQLAQREVARSRNPNFPATVTVGALEQPKSPPPKKKRPEPQLQANRLARMV